MDREVELAYGEYIGSVLPYFVLKEKFLGDRENMERWEQEFFNRMLNLKSLESAIPEDRKILSIAKICRDISLEFKAEGRSDWDNPEIIKAEFLRRNDENS